MKSTAGTPIVEIEDRSIIIRNGMRTPDGTEIISKFRHDYVVYEDANGKSYMVDGGNDYLRRSVSPDAVDISVYWDANNHERNASVMKWGTRGKNGDLPPAYKPIDSLDTDHIEAILNDFYRGVQPLATHYQTTLQKELDKRNASQNPA